MVIKLAPKDKYKTDLSLWRMVLKVVSEVTPAVPLLERLRQEDCHKLYGLYSTSLSPPNAVN